MPTVQSQTQRIIVNPPSNSVSVVLAGPIGPRGLTGPPDAENVLTVDGQIMTRVAGQLAPITRDNLAQDSAFTSRSIDPSVFTADEQLLTRIAGVPAPITREDLAADPAFVAMVPAGTVVDYMGTTAPAGWVILAGQTITNGQTLYPEWWAILPASMKSGSNIVCPDTRGKVTVGHNTSDADFDVIGDTGGAKTHTLVTGELPVHAHSLGSHTHTASSATVSADHTHAFNVNSGNQSAFHQHDPQSGAGHGFAIAVGGVSTTYVEGAGGTSYKASAVTYNLITGNENTNHHHNVSGNTGGISANHVHAITVNAASGNTGNAGSGTAHNNLQPYVVFSKMVRAY